MYGSQTMYAGGEALEAVLQLVAERVEQRDSIEIERGMTEPGAMDHVARIGKRLPERLTGLRGNVIEEDRAEGFPAHLHLEAACAGSGTACGISKRSYHQLSHICR